MGDAVQSTESNIDSATSSTLEAPQAWNSLPVQDTSIVNAIWSPEPKAQSPFIIEQGTYHCQMPIYIPNVSTTSFVFVLIRCDLFSAIGIFQ